MYNNSIVESKERLIGLDIVRVISCFMILTFHTFYSLSLSYGFLDKYVEKGAIFVSVFFILSGFSLYYSNYKKNLSQIKEMKLFCPNNVCQYILPSMKSFFQPIPRYFKEKLNCWWRWRPCGNIFCLKLTGSYWNGLKSLPAYSSIPKV